MFKEPNEFFFTYIKSFLIVLFLTTSISLKAEEKSDSLYNLLQTNNRQEKIEILNEISTFFLSSDANKSITYAQKAVDESKIINDKHLQALSLMNLGISYYFDNQPEKAKALFYESIVIYENLNDFKGISNNFVNLGNLNYAHFNYDSAEYFYEKAIGIKSDINDSLELPILYKKLGLVLINKKEFQKAEEILFQSLDLYNKDLLEKKSIYETISILYESQNKFEESLKYHKLYTKLKDSLHFIHLEQEQINNKTTKDNNKTQTGLYIGFLLILFFTGLIYYNYRGKIKANKSLSIQNKKILKQNEEIKTQSLNLSRINRELEKLSIVASKTDNAIIISDQKGNIEWINESYTKLYGFNLNELLQEKGSTYIETSSCSDIKELFNIALTEKRTQIYECDVTAKNGKIYRIQTTLTPILDENQNITNLIAIDSDITKLKDVERELQKLLFTKDRFFSIIAHDLKNPFNNLMGISQLLVQGFERMTPEKVKYFHKGLYDISKHGYELLINLLEWSKSQKGNIEFNPNELDLNKLIEETFLLFNTKANQKEIALTNTVEANTIISADINMLKTILRNLVSNALKFTDRGGAIEVCTQTTNTHIEITVRDTGIGISPEAVNNLFKLDEYISTEGTENETGTGLGLILCKEFVETHSGKIWVESKVGFGTKFVFTLPILN
ncbi:MAG: PAS domain S-box protein [Bacteroidales bacterium]|nr:PAS domain S-box protein [Bacteroidales bacterium]